MPELYPAQPPLKEAKWARARSRDDCFCILSLFLTQDLNVGWPGRLKWVIGWSGHERADTKWSHPCWGASLPPPWYCTHTHTHMKKPLLNTILPFFFSLPPSVFPPLASLFWLPPLSVSAFVASWSSNNDEIFISYVHFAAHCGYYICSFLRTNRHPNKHTHTTFVLLRLTLTHPQSYIPGLNPNPSNLKWPL